MKTVKKYIFTFKDPVYREPKKNYVDYFNDMYHFTGGYLDNEMLLNKSGYSFCELIDLVVDEDKAILDFLKKTDLCLMISNTYDHDSNYSHIASYLIEKYHIKADFLDVIAEEDSESKIAFHIVDSYFLRNIINSAIVIKFTQRSLPLRINANIALPEYNCVEVLILERGGYSLADLKPNGTTLKQ